jgi:hypothetical protein
MTPSEFHATLLCMEQYGGTFCTNLAAALRYADPSNRQKIWDAFPEILEKYGPTGPFQKTREAILH